jgi:hypothetical protein
MQESPGTDPSAEAAGSGRGRRRLTLTSARRSSSFLERRWSVFDKVCSYGITTTEPDNGEAARPVLVDGEGGLW